MYILSNSKRRYNSIHSSVNAWRTRLGRFDHYEANTKTRVGHGRQPNVTQAIKTRRFLEAQIRERFSSLQFFDSSCVREFAISCNQILMQFVLSNRYNFSEKQYISISQNAFEQMRCRIWLNKKSQKRQAMGFGPCVTNCQVNIKARTTRAGKNLRFLKMFKVFRFFSFLRYLGFKLRGTLYALYAV